MEEKTPIDYALKLPQLTEQSVLKSKNLSVKGYFLWLMLNFESDYSTVDFSNKNLSIKELNYILNKIEENFEFIKLVLKNCSFSMEAWKKISAFLEKNTTLLDLDIGGNPTDTGGFNNFISRLTINTTLKNLNLSDIFLGDDQGIKLINALNNNKFMSSIRLDNTGLGDKFIYVLAELLPQYAWIKEVSLKNNKITDEVNPILINIKEHLPYCKFDLTGNSLPLETIQKLSFIPPRARNNLNLNTDVLKRILFFSPQANYCLSDLCLTSKEFRRNALPIFIEKKLKKSHFFIMEKTRNEWGDIEEIVEKAKKNPHKYIKFLQNKEGLDWLIDYSLKQFIANLILPKINELAAINENYCQLVLQNIFSYIDFHLLREGKNEFENMIYQKNSFQIISLNPNCLPVLWNFGLHEELYSIDASRWTRLLGLNANEYLKEEALFNILLTGKGKLWHKIKNSPLHYENDQRDGYIYTCLKNKLCSVLGVDNLKWSTQWVKFKIFLYEKNQITKRKLAQAIYDCISSDKCYQDERIKRKYEAKKQYEYAMTAILRSGETLQDLLANAKLDNSNLTILDALNKLAIDNQWVESPKECDMSEQITSYSMSK